MKSPHGKQKKAAKPLMSKLAIRIVERIRAQALPAGCHVGEQGLADAFHVSRGPVREALRILEREGVVIFHPNRGFFLARSAGEIPNLNIEPPVSPEEEKYYQFAEDRINGKLHGSVSEAELMARYGISRVKLMKILVRMSQEGWVERRPGHGWLFLPVLDSFESLDRSYRFRILVEPAALLEPTYRFDPVIFGQLRREHEALLSSPLDEKMPYRMFETGVHFHEQILACSGNPFFLEAVRHINRLRRLIEYQVQVNEDRLNRFHEHVEIISLLEKGDQAGAADLLRDHLERSRARKTASDPEEKTK